jgi:hypothetical protein
VTGECETERGWPRVRVAAVWRAVCCGGRQAWRGLRTECSAAAPRNDCGARGPLRQTRHPRDGLASWRAPSRRLASRQFFGLSSRFSAGSWRSGPPPAGCRPPPTRSSWPPARPAALRVAPRGAWAWTGVVSAGGESSAPAASALGRHPHPTCPGARGPPTSIAARGSSRAPTSPAGDVDGWSVLMSTPGCSRVVNWSPAGWQLAELANRVALRGSRFS